MNELLEEEVYNFINRTQGTSFVEIENKFPELFGEGFILHHTDYPSIIFWIDFSKIGVEIFKRLLSDKKIQIDQTPLLVYYMDGKVLNIPIAKKLREYKTDRWMPTVLNAVNH